MQPSKAGARNTARRRRGLSRPADEYGLMHALHQSVPMGKHAIQRIVQGQSRWASGS